MFAKAHSARDVLATVKFAWAQLLVGGYAMFGHGPPRPNVERRRCQLMTELVAKAEDDPQVSFSHHLEYREVTGTARSDLRNADVRWVHTDGVMHRDRRCAVFGLGI